MDLALESIWVDLVFSILFVFLAAKVLGKADGPLRLSKRLPIADFIKGIAIIAVVLIHVANFAPIGKPLNPYFGFGVELFLICSGYLLARRYAGKIGLTEYFSKIFWRVVLIYAAFVIALHLIAHSFAINPGQLAQEFVFGSPQGGIYYFIPVIFQFYLVFPILKSWTKGKLSLALLISALCISLVWAYIDTRIRTPQWNSDPLVLAFAGRYLFFFLLGIYLSGFELEHFEKRQMAAICIFFLAAAAAITIAEKETFFGYSYAVFALFASILAYHAAKKIPLATKTIESLGRNSLVIYLVHGIVLSIAGAALAGIEGAAAYLLFGAISIALSCIFAEAFMIAYRKLVAFAIQA